VERQARILDDPLVTEYVNRIGQNLVRNSDARVPFTFKVIRDDRLNAFALPGGFVFVNTGLIEIAEDESELAGAMAHEIAHVAARHSTRKATKSQLASLAASPLGILLGGWASFGARQAAGLGIPLAMLEFDRRDESEADYFGVQYAYAAGYDPNGIVTVFEKLASLQRRKSGAFARVFSSHPMDETRIREAQKEIQRILPAKQEYVVTTSEYSAMRTRLIRLSSGPDFETKVNKPRLRVPGGATGPEDSGDPDTRPTVRRGQQVLP
jgi:predicted Zn-dependent protease